MTRIRSLYETERANEAAAARRRMAKRETEINPFPESGTSHQKAAHEAGGTLIGVRLKSTFGPNGGCGAPTHVVGTNGGTLPCGSMLTMFGETKPYYCGHCDPDLVADRSQ